MCSNNDTAPEWRRSRIVATLLVLAAGLNGFPSASGAGGPKQHGKGARFDTKEADFSIRYNGEVAAYRDLSTFVLPGTTLRVEVAAGPPGQYRLVSENAVAPSLARSWQWRAPQAPGAYDLRIEAPSASSNPSSEHAITLHVFVLVPASEVRNGYLNGYRIGYYPAESAGQRIIYRPPVGFVEVTKKNEDVSVSPHFRLKQFLCKQETVHRFPQYVVLKERLVLELEAILERVNLLGFEVDTLHLMSAYRTPFYNRAIGDVLYSQHQWGSAADIYIDKENKNRMDDLNRDGQIDVDDSRYLYEAIEQMLADRANRKFEGGMGFYPGTSAHPPFVHVDVRGFRARWRG